MATSFVLIIGETILLSFACLIRSSWMLPTMHLAAPCMPQDYNRYGRLRQLSPHCAIQTITIRGICSAEDCLFLNVFTPRLEEITESLPVFL